MHDRTAATAVVRSHHPRPTRHTPGPWPTLRPSSSHDAPSPPAQHGPPSNGNGNGTGNGNGNGTGNGNGNGDGGTFGPGRLMPNQQPIPDSGHQAAGTP
ncbi:hypothetical protein E7X38_09820 [Streptomyces sp. Akac8]|nr:hypothetical protein E7X38_09820 [Streptomyces sp. Akac8]